MSEIGFSDSFFQEFSQITKEGYELKATHPLASFTVLGTGGDTQHMFYFQRRADLIEKENERLDLAKKEARSKIIGSLPKGFKK